MKHTNFHSIAMFHTEHEALAYIEKYDLDAIVWPELFSTHRYHVILNN